MSINIILIIIILSLIIFNYNKLQSKFITECFYNSSSQLGNTICSYFYDYAISVCNKEDFTCETGNYKIIKDLPTFIPFNIDLYNKFQENNITSDLIKLKCTMCLWHCNEQWIYDFWIIMKPTIHKILNNAIIKSNLKNNIKYPIIHFRCADVPFVKHPEYYLQKYDFFKTALEKIPFNENKTVIIMYYLNHLADENKINACNIYLNNLVEYINNLGYNCKLQSKENYEDFADLFNAPYVISTGGSFSFMSGFFGQGTFISTEHCENSTNCCENCNVFLKNYNIPHNLIDSYYDIDNVEAIRKN